MTLAPATAPSPWSAGYARNTVGLFSLSFLFAFEALAVGTVMPAIAADLHGLSLYAVGFAAPTAASVLALAVAGGWVDRHGPRPAITAGGWCSSRAWWCAAWRRR